MARKRSIKNGKQLVELLDHTPLPALAMLREIEPFDFLEALDVSKPEAFDRRSIIDLLTTVSPAAIVIANEEAARLTGFSGLRAQKLLERAYDTLTFEDHPELASFNPEADVTSRLIWVRRHAPKLFDQLERVYLTYHFHGHKKFAGFNVAEGEQQALEWTEELEDQLHAAVMEVLALDEKARDECELIHFEMEEGDGEGKRTLHYLVVYHPGKMRTLRQMVNSRRDLMTYIPALEATLVYDPHRDRVHVLSDRRPVARALADEFVTRALGKGLSEEPVDAAIYDLSVFKNPIDLERQAKASGARVEKAWVSELTVTLGHSRHRITLQLGHEDDVWSVSNQHLGQSDPIERARSVLEAKLSFVVRFDGEKQSVPLDITIGSDGSCTLFTLREPRLRRCAEDILTSLGVMKRVVPAPVGADKALFLAELQLLDLMADEVDGHLLAALNLPPASELVDAGLLTQKAFGDSITVCEEDEEGRPVYRRLTVVQDSSRTYAVDEESGERFDDLTEDDLRRYQINKRYLHQRLLGLLADQLAGELLDDDDAEPFFLGDYGSGDQPLPIHVATALWHQKHADKMDIEVRNHNMGVGVTLTTSSVGHPHYLGPSIVVPITTLIDDSATDVRLDLTRLGGAVRKWRSRAAVSELPKLLKENGASAVLVGPWKNPWILTSAETVAAVDVLVQAWLSGKRKCTKDQVLAGYGGARTVIERFRKDPQWTIYIRGADGNAKPRLWELNIGKAEYASGKAPEAVDDEEDVAALEVV